MNHSNACAGRRAPELAARLAQTVRARCRPGLAALLLAAGAASAASAQVSSACDECPVPENELDRPAIGTHLGPGLMGGGYGTLQLNVPGSSATQATNHSEQPGKATDSTGPGRREWSDHHSKFQDVQAARRNRLSVSHLSGILWWEPSPVWKLLAEVDSQEVLQVPEYDSGVDGTAGSPFVALERLYVEHRFSDALTLRGGKFLTPIGKWNQEHPDPLTWTTLRPLISQSAFPTNATGLMTFGELPGEWGGIEWQAFASGRANWRAGPSTNPFTHAAGVRLGVPLTADLRLSASFARFTQEDAHDDRRRLFGLDAAWTWRGAELSAEAIRRRGSSDNPDDSEHGWFVQAALPLVPRVHAVVRLEAYRRAFTADSTQTALVGLVYRSGRHWVFKAEWVHASPSGTGLPQGLLASMTALF